MTKTKSKSQQHDNNPLIDNTSHIPIQRRISNRAKRLALHVSPLGQVELVIPRNCPRHIVEAFLSNNTHWLHQQLENMEQLRRANAERFCSIPKIITLPALPLSLEVSYVKSNTRRLTQTNNRIVVQGEDKHSVRRLLRQWLKNLAKNHFSMRLAEISHTTGYQFHRLQVRSQKTRWGSCSGKKTISLNQNLLFLCADLVDYVCLHELTHTQFMNHSKEFWNSVASHQPDYRNLDKQLNGAIKYIPAWALEKI